MTNEDFQQHVIDSLARLETHVGGLVGSDQTGPGRVTVLEEKVNKLEKKSVFTTGVAVGASTVVSSAATWVANLIYHHK